MDPRCSKQEEVSGERQRTICTAGRGGVDKLRGGEEYGMGTEGFGAQNWNVSESKSELQGFPEAVILIPRT